MTEPTSDGQAIGPPRSAPPARGGIVPPALGIASGCSDRCSQGWVRVVMTDAPEFPPPGRPYGSVVADSRGPTVERPMRSRSAHRAPL